MPKIDAQLSLADLEYGAFVEKFKPKKTTDDCYTPPNVYEAILGWVRREYGLSEDVPIVRPFWPGGDYEREEYPEGCVVVDNPPFSIISKICADYKRAGVRFFLFAPYLTNFSSQQTGLCHVLTDADILYENGASINTSFVTNLDPAEVRSAPELNRLIIEADKVNRSKQKRELPKYSYPDAVLTATMVGRLSKYGVDYRLARESCTFIRALDSQRAVGKGIFGSGYLLSTKAAAEKAAAEKAAAHRWPLSRAEVSLIAEMDAREARHEHEDPQDL